MCIAYFTSQQIVRGNNLFWGLKITEGHPNHLLSFKIKILAKSLILGEPETFDKGQGPKDTNV